MTDVPAAVAAGDLSFLDEEHAQRVDRRAALVRLQDARGRRTSRSPRPSPLRTESPLLSLCAGRGALPGRARTRPTRCRSGCARSRRAGRPRDPRGRGLDGLRRAGRPGARARAAAPHALERPTSQVEQDEFMLPLGRVGAAPACGGTVDVRPVGVEQSNSSVVFGDALILKAFRRVEPGVNPELELLRFLSARGFPHIAPLAGWYEVEGRLLDATLGILQEFLAGARDGWELTLDELGSDPDGLLGARARARRGRPASCTRRSASDARRPRVRARRAEHRGAVAAHGERRRADRARLPRPAGRPTPWRRSPAAGRTCARGSTRSRTSARAAG